MTGSPFFCAGLSISLAEFGEIGAVSTTATLASQDGLAAASQRAADSMDGLMATSLTRWVTISQADGA
jgi:hypothetical protein